ncbi:MAG: alpha/beta fold hydrolase, partial [Anaerolineae bacterium]|nr:alpha/beta fold hydrolase [Anaerolineae bacterium]
KALGYEEWNLYGISYGTRLALAVMRDHPEGVRSVVLDSTYPLMSGSWVEELTTTEEALNTLFDGCMADAHCSAQHPDLETMFYALVEQLEAQPVTFSVVHPVTGTAITLTMDGSTLVNLVYVLLYDTSAIPWLPRLIVQASQGDISGLARYGTGVIAWFMRGSNGVALSIKCAEVVPYSDPADLGAVIAVVRPELRDVLQENVDSQTAVCAVWDVPPADPIENQAVTSTIPTLILAGAYDPVTPPEWGYRAAETLPNSYVYLFPAVGHGVTGRELCSRFVSAMFLNDPTAAPDAPCLARLRGPVFYR